LTLFWLIHLKYCTNRVIKERKINRKQSLGNQREQTALCALAQHLLQPPPGRTEGGRNRASISNAIYYKKIRQPKKSVQDRLLSMEMGPPADEAITRQTACLIPALPRWQQGALPVPPVPQQQVLLSWLQKHVPLMELLPARLPCGALDLIPAPDFSLPGPAGSHVET